ncbi:MAG TPA: hypothetical protein VFI57_02270 [Pyrinomonadaceae bacterium]|nr:hypothetical protein [Pyrinomonadaceae bacterium]
MDFDHDGLARCAVCTRRSSQLFLCDKCYVISFESNTPLDIKNFTLTADGVPQPSCPSCLRPASADQHEHDCEELRASFITALTTCPICDERLDIAPAFPSTVAQYLKRTRSAHKINVTFDYETESFVPVEDGEFVLVNTGDPNIQPIVLPRAPRFATRRDFYEFYQDYYHCPKPDAGEVRILRPAAVNRSGAGWKLQATGLLEVISEQPKKKPVEVIAEQPKKKPIEVAVPALEPIVQKRIDELRALDAKRQNPALKTCEGCGASIESRYAFCWKCGHAMSSQSNGPVVVRSKPLPLPMEDDELTVQHDVQGGSGRGENPMFSWTMSKPPERAGASRGSVLKLMAIGGVSVMLLALGMFGLTRSDSPVEAANQAAPQVVEQPAASQPEPVAQPTNTVVADQKPQQTAVNPEDELQKLRAKRIDADATPSERSKVFQAFAKVERQYPRDYRFPYERAKLAAKGSKASSRNEAFKALSAAAEKAITTGKANEMLSGLEADKAGDFQKLAQGRQEWSRLLAALKRKDTTLLARDHTND